jgi:hypothetical protein
MSAHSLLAFLVAAALALNVAAAPPLPIADPRLDDLIGKLAVTQALYEACTQDSPDFERKHGAEYKAWRGAKADDLVRFEPTDRYRVVLENGRRANQNEQQQRQNPRTRAQAAEVCETYLVAMLKGPVPTPTNPSTDVSKNDGVILQLASYPLAFEACSEYMLDFATKYGSDYNQWRVNNSNLLDRFENSERYKQIFELTRGIRLETAKVLPAYRAQYARNCDKWGAAFKGVLQPYTGQ